MQYKIRFKIDNCTVQFVQAHDDDWSVFDQLIDNNVDKS